jgi:hypothetical protein
MTLKMFYDFLRIGAGTRSKKGQIAFFDAKTPILRFWSLARHPKNGLTHFSEVISKKSKLAHRNANYDYTKGP